MSTTRMPRERLLNHFEMFSEVTLTCRAGTISRLSVTGKTRPQPPKISRSSLQSMTSHSTRFTERSLLAVRGLCRYFLPRTHLP